jgi:pimeloyl-ACP methyl ester carboxylesterase
MSLPVCENPSSVRASANIIITKLAVDVSDMISRRQLLHSAGLMLAGAAAPDLVRSAESSGIRSRQIDNNNGLVMHVLEAGYEGSRHSAVILLHGFPELAYTWRHQLTALSQAGFHVIAPDLRGYGLTCRAPVTYADELVPYMMMNRVADVLGLTRALGYEKVAAVVGHDWGAPVAQWCALTRPDVFQSVVSMSNPFYGTPRLALNTANSSRSPGAEIDIQKELAALPRPRKHYLWYCASEKANDDMWHAPQGVHDLLCAMYHFKSADWPGNKPFPLKAWTASELAKLPAYYVMDLDKGIAQTMATAMPTKVEVASCRWMSESDLAFYSSEFSRTGFQGGLNSYRIETNPEYSAELNSFAGRKIEVPACFIGGANDWGVRQAPGAYEAMHEACTRLVGIHLVDGAGHSVPEEQPQKVSRLLINFIQRAAS